MWVASLAIIFGMMLAIMAPYQHMTIGEEMPAVLRTMVSILGLISLIDIVGYVVITCCVGVKKTRTKVYSISGDVKPAPIVPKDSRDGKACFPLVDAWNIIRDRVMESGKPTKKIIKAFDALDVFFVGGNEETGTYQKLKRKND